MADREHHNGRMRFTDFDASDKGRPVAVFDGETARAVPEPPFPTAAVPSLDDIAANLGLDFEDDGEDAPPPPSPARPAEKRPDEEPAGGKAIPLPSAVSAPPPEEDHELSLGEAENFKSKTGIHAPPPPAGAPTWDSLTGAYAQARPAAGDALPDGRDRFAAAFAPPTARDDDEVDVLSMLDEYLERESRPLASLSEPHAESGAAGAAFPEARPLPYGGVERVDDWFAPPENQPEPPPRIEDWFSPPEEQQEGVLRVDNWYEPPEAEDGGREDPGETKVDISWLSDFRNELPAGEYWHKKTTRILKRDAASPDAAPDAVTDAVPAAGTNAEPAASSSGPPSVSAGHDADKPRPAAADTAELFSDVDFNALWEDKVAEKRQSRPAAASDSDTRRISLFDDLGIDSLWEQKREEKTAGAPRPSASGGDATTIIAGQELPDAAATVILRDGLLAQGAFDASRSGGGAGARAEERLPDPEAPDVLDELDGITAESLPRRSAAAEAAPSGKTATQTTAQPQAPRGPHPATAAGRSAPETAEIGETAETEPPPAPFADSVPDAEAVAGFDGAVIGDGAPRGGLGGADGEEREYVARTPPAGPPGKKGLSTDDLLNDIDMDSLAGGAGDVSAPVIDDSAIDAIEVGTKSGTAEMRAVAEGDAAEEEEPVAVNPMDVFADMDNMDFSDDVDDDMRALLEDEEAEGAEEDAAGDAQAGAAAAREMTEVVPATRFGRAWLGVSKLARRYLPMRYADKALGMVAWRENWWFYCDLVAAIMASASLAVIISYFFWYRGV